MPVVFLGLLHYGDARASSIFNASALASIFAFLVYPASHAFNTHYDRDESSIGGLRHPPPVDPLLLPVALALDFLALVLCNTMGWPVTIAVLVYGLASKAYSHPSTRWKARPFWGWFVVSFFQGTWTFLCFGLLGPWRGLPLPGTAWGAAASFFLISAAYPITQIYQHQEDARRGDQTLSRRLGVQGTYWFTILSAAIAQFCMANYFLRTGTWSEWLVLQIGFTPGLWIVLSSMREWKHDFDFADKLGFWGATGINIALVVIFWMRWIQP